MKKYIFLFISVFIFSSCSDFLDRNPGDALSPATFWKTEDDAKLALTGCYKAFQDSWRLLYLDCGSDNAYNFHRHEGYQAWGDGSLSQSEPGTIPYTYTTIRKCNEFLENIGNVPDEAFKNSKTKASFTAEVRFIRAYNYFVLVQYYGSVPLITETLDTPADAMLPRDSKEKLQEFILKELNEAVTDMLDEPAETGRVAKAAGYALLSRIYLHWGMYAEAITAGTSVAGRELFPSFEELFWMENKNCNEIILNYEHLEAASGLTNDMTRFLPNSGGGWSSVVPLQSLVDAYEMIDGKTIEEAKATGEYDEANPYINRDPRLRSTVIYPGQVWNGKVYRSVESGDKDNPNGESNASKSAYNFRKYVSDVDKYDYWNNGRSLIILRYAEVLLNIAEAKIELDQIDNVMYDALDKVRTRAGMPKVDRVKYNNQTKLRELVRRERRVELAFEGHRRFDIVRWGIAKDVMNKSAMGARSGIVLDETYPNGDHKVNLTGEYHFIETRTFEDKHNLFPIPQTAIDKNPNLLPNNPGY